MYGARDRNCVVHHLDENKLNNQLSNLRYLKNSEHVSFHQKGKKLSEEAKQKLSAANKGQHRSEETKQKISSGHKGKNNWTKNFKWFNNGITEIRCKPDEVPAGFVIGRINNWTKNLKWFNNGVKNIRCKSDEVPPEFVIGRIKN